MVPFDSDSALILGFEPSAQQRVRPSTDYESHGVTLLFPTLHTFENEGIDCPATGISVPFLTIHARLF